MHSEVVFMRKISVSIDEIKARVLALKGSEIEMKFNKGRKRFDTISGTIKDVYPSVFTVCVKDSSGQIQTFSYYDVLCGNVIIL